MHKHKGNGDAIRVPFAVRRQVGKQRRWNRHEVPTDD
jgi:hypothetical protein